jgi:hypothetical protein
VTHSSASPQAVPARRVRWPLLALTAVLLLVVPAGLWWWQRFEAMPVSAPPPGGGTLTVPPSLGGVPKSPTAMDPTWARRSLPTYDPDDVLLQYYVSPDQGLVSVVALRGPVEDLGDRKGATGDPGEWNVIGDAQCGPLYHNVGERSTKGDGHVCWRSSGDFSMSVLTAKQDAVTTARLLDEMWAAQ